MTINEILKEKIDNHIGYQLQSIAVSLINQDDLYLYDQLVKIPHKITAFLHRDKIAMAFKSDHAAYPEDNYYLVQAIDGTIFHLEY